ncbi:MAG: HU family DNA-binding protein [Succinivibrio sp.]|jgi:DNA-binding protein HU-beta|nr:HU family DNA-binding protein [Succinivibrio sp.]
MNKSELIEQIALKSGLTPANSKKALEALVSTVSETLAAGDRVQLVGFGTFRVTERAAREGCNPQTKQKIIIPATKTPSFSAGAELKKSVNS